MDDYKLLPKLKPHINDIIYDLDRHFPEDALTDKYYEWFYEHYILPILNTVYEHNK